MMTNSTRQQLLEEAQQGNIESQYLLGLSFMEEDDREQAKTWFLKAAEQDHPNAIMELATVYYLEDNLDEAWAWWKRATQLDEVSADALHCLHRMAEREEKISFEDFAERFHTEGY